MPKLETAGVPQANLETLSLVDFCAASTVQNLPLAQLSTGSDG